MKQRLRFDSDKNNLVGNFYFPSKKGTFPGVLFIHGAGNSSAIRYQQIQGRLAEKGVASFCFDMRGVQDSKGKFEDGSLNNRLVDSINAYRCFIGTGLVDAKRVGLFGSSMGAHVACRLLEKAKIKAVVLQCGAAYGLEAEDKKLDETFTNVIRKEKSWQGSPAFLLLKNFLGPVCVIYGEQDAVIPQKVRELYGKSLKKSDVYKIFPGIGHNLLKPLSPEEENITRDIISYTINFFVSKLKK